MEMRSNDPLSSGIELIKLNRPDGETPSSIFQVRAPVVFELYSEPTVRVQIRVRR